MRRSLLTLASVVLAVAISTSAEAEVRVLTSIKPLQLIAAAIQQELGEPDVLLPPGASAHHYSLRPSDMRRLQQAQLFYWIGPDLESFLAGAVAGREPPTLAVEQLPGLRLRHFAAGNDEQAQAHSDEADDHDHRAGSLDAHLWLLPANARVIAARMTEDLAHADPANAARYRENLAAFEARLEQFDQRLRTRLAPLHGKPYFVAHDAYGYFEQAYGLEHAGVFNLGGEVQPGARHVAALREQLKAVGPSCVFSEPPLRPRLVDTLTAGLPVKMAELDPLGSAITPGPQGYEQLLGHIANGLAGCLESL